MSYLQTCAVLALVLFVPVLSFADRTIIASCDDMKVPTGATNGAIDWQEMDGFSLTIYKNSDGTLTAEGGPAESPVNASGDEIQFRLLTKENVLEFLNEFVLEDPVTGAPIDISGLDRDAVSRALLYNILVEDNDEGNGLMLLIVQDALGQTLGKIIRLGWMLGMCER